MTQDHFTPRDLLAGQRVGQALAAGLDMEPALISNAADLFEAATRDPGEAYRLSRQISDTLRLIASLVPRQG